MFHNESNAGNHLFVNIVPQPEASGAKVELFCPGRLGEDERRATIGFERNISPLSFVVEDSLNRKELRIHWITIIVSLFILSHTDIVLELSRCN